MQIWPCGDPEGKMCVVVHLPRAGTAQSSPVPQESQVLMSRWSTSRSLDGPMEASGGISVKSGREVGTGRKAKMATN